MTIKIKRSSHNKVIPLMFASGLATRAGQERRNGAMYLDQLLRAFAGNPTLERQSQLLYNLFLLQWLRTRLVLPGYGLHW